MSESDPYQVFLSYSQDSQDFVESLARRLQGDARFSFWFAPWHSVPGVRIQEQMEVALKQASSCAVFIGSGQIHGWQNEQMRTAIQTRVEDVGSYRVIPVFLPGAERPKKQDLPSFLRRYEPVEFRSLDDEQAFKRLLSGILGIPPIQVEGFLEVQATKSKLAPPAPERLQHWHALIIGIASYSRVPNLQTTVINDAHALATLLTDPARCGYPPSNVVQLLDGKATGMGIRAALDDLASRTGPEDTVIIYYSGHGVRVREGGETQQYILPYDSNLADLRGTAIADNEMLMRLQQIRAGRLLVLFDSCHGGGESDLTTMLPEAQMGLDESCYETLARRPGRAVIAASRSQESAWMLPGMTNSLFTYYVLAAFRGQAKTLEDGYLRVFDLFRHVSENVPQRAPQPQHPVFKTPAMEEDFAIAFVKKDAAESYQPSWIEVLTAKLNVDELHSLSASLGIDYDGLLGKDVDSKTRQLVERVDLRGRIPDLISSLPRIRPDIPWAKALQTQQPIEKGLEETEGTIAKASGKPPRYANYELYHLGKRNEQHSQLETDETLRVNHWYEVEVWIAAEATGKPIGDEEGKRQPIREPGCTESVTVYVLFEPDSTYFEFNENDRVQTLQLPPAGGGDSTKATLHIRPKMRSLSKEALAEVGVHFYYNFNKIESIKILAEVAGRDDEPARSLLGLEKPISATYRKLGNWRNLEEIQRREMHITVRSLANDRYELIFLYEEVEFKGALRLTKEEVEDCILRARDLLEYLAVHPDSPIIREHPRRLKAQVCELAEIGRLLWCRVFQSDKNRSLWHIGKFLKDHPLKRDGIIQVVIEDNAAGFVFPWNLLFDGPYPLDTSAPIRDILDGFWGMRYCIEQFYGNVLNSWSGCPVQLDQELQVSFLLLQELPNADKQQQFIGSLPRLSQQRIRVSEPITAADDCYRLFKNCDSHILYFFTRGYTRRRQADLAFKPDLKRGELGEPEHEESYIELSNDKLYLRQLEVNKDSINLNRGPVVLLNMCEGAQITPSLSEGFVPFFLDQQASAVIGTECPMTTRFAHPFAIAFFDAFLNGDPLGTALLKARRRFLMPDELLAPLGLAYTLYGLATIRFQPPPLSERIAGAIIDSED